MGVLSIPACVGAFQQSERDFDGDLARGRLCRLELPPTTAQSAFKNPVARLTFFGNGLGAGRGAAWLRMPFIGVGGTEIGENRRLNVPVYGMKLEKIVY